MDGIALAAFLVGFPLFGLFFQCLFGDGGSVGEGQNDPLPSIAEERWHGRGPHGRPAG